MFLLPFFPLILALALALALPLLFVFFLSSYSPTRFSFPSSPLSHLLSSSSFRIPSPPPLAHTCHICGGLRLNPPCFDDADHFLSQLLHRLRSFWRPLTFPQAPTSFALMPRLSPEPLPDVPSLPSEQVPLPPSSSLLVPDNPPPVSNADAGAIVPSASSMPSGDAEAPPRISHMSTKAGTNRNDPHLHRVILEILMSPGANSENETEARSGSASGLTLKLETNATLEHLATLREAFARQCSQKCKSNDADSEVDSLFCPPDTDTDPDTLGTHDHHSPSLLAVKINSETNSENRAVPHVLETPQISEKSCNEQHVLVANSCNVAVSKESLNVRMNRQNKENGHRQLLSENRDERNVCFAGAKGEVPSQDCLGSLQLAFLTAPLHAAVKDHKVVEMNHPSLSALATINVANKSVVDRELDGFREDNLGDAGGGCQESGSPEASEQNLMHDSSFRNSDDGASFSKREKRKKKNRVRKQKAKADASEVDAQEIQNIGKVCLEAVKHATVTSEREVGCICGASKGGLHTNNCPYPFTSSGSILQRKIKEQYDELVRCNAAKTLTLAQVGRFTTRLVETKATLQQKSEIIQRKFTIAKSLLSKADKSSFDRLWGQIYGLEMEQKKLEEDTVVYNRLQEQLKLSPAYKKMIEYGRTHLEMQPHSGRFIDKLEPDTMEMSFEEFLAQEKKDVYWQKHGFVKSSVQAR